MHPSEMTDAQLLGDCDVRRQRRSGPGGQHRNKVETAIVLTHLPSGVKSEASERRSQHENRKVAISRLRVNLALQVRTSRTEEAVPSPRWARRTRDSRLSINTRHDDFPSLLAEALDVVTAQQFDVPAAARQLGVTTSQLVRFLKLEQRAMAQVNRAREAIGLHALK